MTVIAWDGMTMAGDSALTSPGGTINRVCKVGAVEVVGPRPFIGTPGLTLFGIAGHPAGFQLVHEFLSGQTDELDLTFGDDDSTEALIASATGAWLWNGSRPIPLIRDAKAAIGAGAKAALAVMFMGGGAVKAVEISCVVCDGVADPVQAFTLQLAEPVAEPVELHEAQE